MSDLAEIIAESRNAFSHVTRAMTSSLLPLKKVLTRTSGNNAAEVVTLLRKLEKVVGRARDPRDDEDLRDWLYALVWASLLTERQIKERSESDWLRWFEASGNKYERLSGSWKRAFCHLIDGALAHLPEGEEKILIDAHGYDQLNAPSENRELKIDPVKLLRARRNLKSALVSIMRAEFAPGSSGEF